MSVEVVRVGDRMVPVDAKFPLEACQRMLVATGDEVGGALAAWALDPMQRAQIYAAALAIADASGFGDRLRAFGLDRRVQAIAGGAVVTLAAAAAVSVAIARGRRHDPASLIA